VPMVRSTKFWITSSRKKINCISRLLERYGYAAVESKRGMLQNVNLDTVHDPSLQHVVRILCKSNNQISFPKKACVLYDDLTPCCSRFNGRWD